jgi:8-amino-7-oxononanoate synthase
VPDFTSALYLGLQHPTGVLRPWAALTTGAPAVLRPVPGATLVERRLAALQGAAAAVLMPSTLHVACDLGELWDPSADVIEVDLQAYPILRVAARLAAARGVPVRRFAFDARRRRRPIVITDGLVAGSDGPVPLPAYVEAVRPHGGVVVVDDTQAVGILGADGGGSLRHHGLAMAPDVVVVASMAKAFGVPVAAVSGSVDAMDAYVRRSTTRTHCSPVSVAAVRALAHALEVNAACGDALRARLAWLIRRFRRGLRRLGLRAAGGAFPVQVLPVRDAAALQHRLLAAGVRTAAQTSGVVFVLSARHTADDVDAALAALARAEVAA